MIRLFIGIALFISIFALPWWCSLVLATYGAFRYPHFIEAIIAGCIIDIQYGTHALFGIPVAATGIGIVLVLGMYIVRKHIRYGAF